MSIFSDFRVAAGKIIGSRGKDGHLHNWILFKQDPRVDRIPGWESWQQRTGITNPYGLAKCDMCGAITETDPDSR